MTLESNEENSIQDTDLFAQMNEAIRIVNDKREKLEENVKLDGEVIEKLGCSLAEQADTIKSLESKLASLRTELASKESELLSSQKTVESVKESSQTIIDEL